MMTMSTVRLVPPGLAIIAVTYGLARFAYGLFLPELREAFDLGASVLGLIGSGSYAGYCVAIVVSSIFAARVGPRFMVVATGTVAVAGMALVAAAPTAWVLAAGVLIAGSSSGLASPPMGDAVARAIAYDKQDRANTLINSGTSVGVILSGPAALVAAGQWRVAWAAFAAISLAVLVWNAAIMPGRERSSLTDGEGAGVPRLSLRWLVGPRSLPLFSTAVGMGLASAAYWTFARELIVQAGALGQAGSTTFWMVVGASGLAGGAAGDLVARLRLTRALRSSLLAMAVAIGLLAVAPGAPGAVYGSAALFGSTYIMLTGIILVWAVAVFHERPSAGLGAAFLLIALGQVLGAPLAGTLGDATSLETAFGLFAGVAVATAFIRPRAENARAASASVGR
jgi:predicted MFS family arabinose efflux permease